MKKTSVRASQWVLVLACALAVQGPAAVQAQEGSPRPVDRFGDPLPVGGLARLGTVRFHRAGCAAYSPDGKMIATADRTSVRLWDAATARTIRDLPLDQRCSAVGLLFSHDGKKLAAVGWGGGATQVWALDSFKPVLLAKMDGGSGGGDWGNAAAFSADDKTLVTATSNQLFVWDIVSGKKLKQFPLRVVGGPAWVRMVAFSADGKVAATQGDKKLQLWDAHTGALLHAVELLGGGDTMQFSRDGKLLAVSGYGHWLKLVNVATGKKLPSLSVAERVASVAFSSDGTTLAAASNWTKFSSSADGVDVIQLWDLRNLQAKPVKFPAPGVHSVMFSPDGKTLAWGSHGQTLSFMDRATGRDLRPMASHRGAIKALAYLPDGKRIVSAGEDSTIRTWDAATGAALHVLPGHVGEIFGLALFPNGKRLASCGRDGTFRLWDLERGKSLAVLNDEKNSVVAAAFSADGKRLASGGYRGVVFMRDPATGRVLREVPAYSVASVAFSPDGRTLAALSRKLFLCDLATKTTKKVPVKSGGSSVAYSPDGKLLAVACNEILSLLDTATNNVIRQLPGHSNRRGSVCFSPDSRYLASVSDGWGGIANRSIRVFELATGTEIHPFKKELPIFAAAFSPDGSKLVVGGADATAVILDLRNLTGKQRRARLTEDELAARWESLGAADASQGYEARADLLHAPVSVLPFLAKRLQPALPIDLKRVQAWIDELDSDTFRERDAATRELQQLGDLVRGPLRKALAASPSLERRRRLQALLAKLDQLTPPRLRQLRGIEVLEAIGTPAALRMIGRVAQGNADGLVTIECRKVLARQQKMSAPLPEVLKAQPAPVAKSPPLPPPGPVRPDLDGDPMPDGAIARLGSARWRLVSEPRRILTSPDGKMLAVVNSFAGLEILDAQTGRTIERRPGFFSFGLDLRMAVAVSPAWRKIVGQETDTQAVAVLAVVERGKAEKVKIEYRRKLEAHPVVPEEVETGSHSHGNFEYLSAADFSPDGKALVGAVRFDWHCRGGNVTKEVKECHLVAWNASTGKEIWKSQLLIPEVNTIAFSPDGKTVTVVDQAGVGIWDAAAGRPLRRWQSKEPLFSARYSPDWRWLATGTKGEILLWEVAAGKVRRRLALPGNEIKALAFNPDGKLLAGGGVKTIRFWDPLTGKVHGECSAVANSVEALAFSGDGKTLFSGHEQEQVVRRWDVISRQPSATSTGPITPVRMLAFSLDSRRISAFSTGDDIHRWEAESGKACPVPSKDNERFLADLLAAAGQTALLRCEDSVVAQFAMLLTGKADRIDQVPGYLGSSVDGRRILVQSEKDKLPCLTVLKVSAGILKDKAKQQDHVEREIVWREGTEVQAALAPDGKTVAAAGNDLVCFFDVSTGRERRYRHPTNVKRDFLFRSQSVKFSADGSRLAVIGNEGMVRVLSVHDGRRIAEFAATSNNLTGLAFSPDGQTLLTTSFNAPAHAWEIATGQLIRRLDAATYLFSPDNRLLAGSAGALQVLDLYSGRVVRACKAADNAFGNFAFSPNSKLLAASCADTTILVWPTGPITVAEPGKPWDENSLAAALEKGGATAAYTAIGRLIADQERALPFLERRLRAVPRVDANHIQRLIADLDSAPLQRREAATKDLVRFGALAEPALRAALASDKTAAGTKERIEKLLRELEEKQPPISAEDMLHLRAIQALERMRTTRARHLLETLAHGATPSPRTRAAVEALGRIAAQ